jgi:hypothetical protein
MTDNRLLIGGGAGLGLGGIAAGTGFALHYAGSHNPTPGDIDGLKSKMDAASAAYATSTTPDPKLPSDAEAVKAARSLLDHPVRVIATDGGERAMHLTDLVDERVFPDADSALRHGWAHNGGRAVALLQPGEGQFLVARADDRLADYNSWRWESRTLNWTTTHQENYTDAEGKAQTRTVTDYHSGSAQVREATVEGFDRFEPRDKQLVGVANPDLEELRNLGTPEQHRLHDALDKATHAYESAVADVARAPAELRAARVLKPAGLVVAGLGAAALATYGVSRLTGD